jgi:microcystin-dependent protein
MTWTTGETITAAKLNRTTVPVGSIQALAYVPGAPISGWLYCNGDAVSRSTYADLFAAIGTTYGVGDGSTTFNLPDLRGVFLRGRDDGKGYDSGRTIGSYQADDNKAHTHTYSAFTQAAPNNFSISGSPANAQLGTFTTSSQGTEARPKNIAIHYVISH